MTRKFITLFALGALVALMGAPLAAQQKKSVKDALKDQAKRVAVVKKITPTVVAIFSRGGKGGGSGVLISKDGYALTNYHVVARNVPAMKCGLADGNLYDAVLVGWDKVGDVALIKLLPRKKGQTFPYAHMGDSDTVKAGDWSLAGGNPFLLATDFTPTVTFGMVSGVHRYQYPAGTFLEYTDCIQIDTSINPGNSGGPLYNIKGEIIGINGRGSFDKRGRVNSGVGYAISINQIKNFMGHLRAGLDCDHASLGAIVNSELIESGLAKLMVTNILEECDAYRRGLDFDDQLVSFNGRLVSSTNQYLNILGTYPRGWRVPLEYRRENQVKEILVRLMGKVPRNMGKGGAKKRPGLPGRPIGGGKSAAFKYYKKKSGYINYWFNEFEQKNLLTSFQKHGDFNKLGGKWILKGNIRRNRARSALPVRIEIVGARKKSATPGVKMFIDEFDYQLDNPVRQNEKGELRKPAGSGGFLAAMYMYHVLLTDGAQKFIKVKHGGYAPIYPVPAKGRVKGWHKAKVMSEVLETNLGNCFVNWHFSRKDRKLIGMELRPTSENIDPCEVFLSDYRPLKSGQLFPHIITVRYGDTVYARIELKSIELAKG